MCHNGPMDNESPSPPKQRRGTLVVLLFCVLGPMALPRVWASPKFKTHEKAVLSVLSVLQILLVGYLLMQMYSTYLLSIGSDGPT